MADRILLTKAGKEILMLLIESRKKSQHRVPGLTDSIRKTDNTSEGNCDHKSRVETQYYRGESFQPKTGFQLENSGYFRRGHIKRLLTQQHEIMKNSFNPWKVQYCLEDNSDKDSEIAWVREASGIGLVVHWAKLL